MSGKQHRDESGFALLIVLWTVALLTMIGMQLAGTGRREVQLARNLLDAALLRAAADGAVQHAIFAVIDSPERGWSADGSPHLIRLGTVAISVRLEDESAKVNLNAASPELLAALLERLGEGVGTAASLAAAIVDWRTERAQASAPGPLDALYAAAGKDYQPPGEDFRDLDELGAVLGVTPALLAALRPHVTIYSEHGPDRSTYDPVVAAALRTLGPLPNPASGGPLVVSIVAQAGGPRHTAFSERVVVRIGLQAGRHPYEVLALDRTAPD